MFKDFTVLDSFTRQDPTVFTFLGIVIATIAFIVGIVYLCDLDGESFRVSTLAFVIFAIAGFTAWVTTKPVQCYKVTLKNTVSAEFFDDYKIINQEGKIFTIEKIDKN